MNRNSNLCSPSRCLPGENEVHKVDRDQSLVLRLPPELLLNVAEQLVRLGTPAEGFTLFRRVNYYVLFSLSLCHSRLHRACLEAGMYTKMKPSFVHERPMSLRDFRMFGEFLCRRHYPLASLTIDMSDSEVWEQCARIMFAFPDLNELILTGKARAKRYQTSSLKSGLASFCGSSLVLRRVLMTDMSFQVLLDLQRTHIKSLVVEESSIITKANSLLFLDNGMRKFKGVSGPFFPNLERVKYVGLPWCASRHFHTERTLCECFLAGSRIKHFEVGSFGYKPRIGSRPEHDVSRLNQETRRRRNRTFHDMRYYLLWMLHQHSSSSLETYSETDYIEGPFFGKGRRWDDLANMPTMISTKLILFRCRDLNSLIRFNGGDNCTVGLHLGGLGPPGFQDHSVSMYMASIYEHFPNCDCIFLHTENEELVVPEHWWDFPTQGIMRCIKDTKSLRYFLVGNSLGSYAGIEWMVDEMTFQNDSHRIPYRIMESSEECQHILDVKWNFIYRD